MRNFDGWKMTLSRSGKQGIEKSFPYTTGFDSVVCQSFTRSLHAGYGD